MFAAVLDPPLVNQLDLGLSYLREHKFKRILLFLNVCKQCFNISHVRILQKVKGVLMQNLQHIIFI